MTTREGDVQVIRKGLTFRRFFTQDGKHPYDEVEWETRDAVIPNYKEGGNAFEQRDVEFPKAWSQNSTNIVAQKYFRGTLGSPQRESSVRQLVGRVVDTIRGWGAKDGYFASEQDAQVFADELTHLLVNQKAAFNSPVWFNVGVPDTPQQCSACQPYDALVSTPDGLVPIGKLVEDNAIGSKVFDGEGLTRIVATKANGVKEVLRVHMKSGHALDVTADHLVWRASGRGAGFVPAGGLRADDQLEWHRRGSYGEREIDRREIAEAALAGWLQSDGFVGQYDGTNRSLTIEAMTVTEAENDWVIDLLDEVLPGVHRHERQQPTNDESLDCRRIRLYGAVLEGFVEAWGLRARGVDMAVPERLFTAPLPVVAAYLRSVFQAEGYVSVRGTSARVGMDMISEGVVRGVQQLLARFGIFSRVRFSGDDRENRKGCWSLSIGSVGDQSTFAEEIGFVDPRKVDLLEIAMDRYGLASRDTKKLEIDRIENLGPMDVYDIQTESGEYLSGGLRVHNCFILAVDDTMSSILNWYVEEGTIFKGGSGSGINLSRIRSSREPLAGGGTASGPVSFMRGADASAGTIKSGGKTRRAAKMVVLNADHPDVREFIWCKANEEKKARALRDAGFDMDLDGKDSASIQYQNANNSVRVTDEFMQAHLEDRDWKLKAVLGDEAVETMRARDLMREISQAAWECADPGMQYDTTINEWHTCPASGRINASNPCFTGDARVHTDKGMVRFDDLVRRTDDGETFDVYTHDMTNSSSSESVHLTRPTQIMVNGVKEILKLTFSDGRQIRCTPNHRLWTLNRGWVRAEELAESDEVPFLDQPTPAFMADHRLPVETDWHAYAVRGDWSRELELPEKWDEEFAHYLGWLVGDGSLSGDVVTTVYGSKEDQQEILPRHLELLTRMNGGRAPKPSLQDNGTVQLRLSRRPLARFIEALGVKMARAADKEIPWSVFEAPEEIVRAFLRGLFDADGCATETAGGSRYVGLGSKSGELLRGAQCLLGTLGIRSQIYDVTGNPAGRKFSYTRKRDGITVEYASPGRSSDHRVSRDNIVLFLGLVGFSLSRKELILASMIQHHPRFRREQLRARLTGRVVDGREQTYNLMEPRNHSYIVNSTIVANCSEYMHLDNSACNLSSLNLLKFMDGEGTFDVASFKHAVEVALTAQEIIVGNSSYPTEKIERNARAFRQLGLGYANLGALLMARGLPYDSDGGRAWAGAITALMTGHAYRTSAGIADVTGPFAGFAPNRDAMLRVMRKHRTAADEIDPELVPEGLLSAAKSSWDEAIALGEKHGYRNAQASVLAPTGTIGLMMDCDTTGIEPDLALVKTKKLVGGGTMQIVNQTVPRALARLGYTPEQANDIVAYIAEHNSVVDAPHLREEHHPVFDTSMGQQAIHYMGHVRMMAAAQPFISGAISKTVNMPETATVEEVEELLVQSWKLGLKAVAIYRDNCKVAQPLSADKRKTKGAEEPAQLAQPVRRRLPYSRPSRTTSFQVGDAEGYITAGEYPDDGMGEIFLKVAKQGSTLSGVMDAFAIAVSIALQYGVPLETYVEKFINTRFEPSGMTNDPDIRFASSLVDYVFRRLALDYLTPEQREALGIKSIEERKVAAAEFVPSPAGELPARPDAGGATEETGASDPRPIEIVPGRRAESPEPSSSGSAMASDAPLCYSCGSKMQPSGSCYVCSSCGSTSGCS